MRNGRCGFAWGTINANRKRVSATLAQMVSSLMNIVERTDWLPANNGSSFATEPFNPGVEAISCYRNMAQRCAGYTIPIRVNFCRLEKGSVSSTDREWLRLAFVCT